MLEHVAAAAGEAGLAPVIAVVPPDRRRTGRRHGVVNDAPEQGISRSVRLGLAAVPAEVDAAVLLLGDEPLWGRSRSLEVLVAAMPDAGSWRRERAERIGPPVFLREAASASPTRRRVTRASASSCAASPTSCSWRRKPRRRTWTRSRSSTRSRRRASAAARGSSRRSRGRRTSTCSASPGCWAAFTELDRPRVGDPAYGALHRHAVDTYAVQHPGTDDRRARQSVAVHLIGLCHWLEHGIPPRHSRGSRQALTTEPREWPWLEPPTSYGTTAIDVLAAKDGEEHLRLVREWAASAWEAWSTHHERVRQWAREALP